MGRLPLATIAIGHRRKICGFMNRGAMVLGDCPPANFGSPIILLTSAK
jgi:hypothetical protein